MGKIFIQDLKNLSAGSAVDCVFAVRKKDSIQQYSKGYFFKIGVSDKTDTTGKFNVIFWGTQEKNNIEKIYNSFSEDDIVFVHGKAGTFNNELKIDVNPPDGIIRKASANEYNAEDFLPTTNQNIEEMEKELRKTINEINNKFLKKLLLKFFDDKNFMEKFRTYPGAILYHHACVGGLMEHTLEVVKLCKAISEIHPTGIDMDLAVTGAILHDIGKTETITVRNISYTNDNPEDILRGHMSIAEEMILKKISEIDEEAKSEEEKFPKILKHKLLHIILSHHGKIEQGTVIEPAIPEAAAVYASDYFSSSVTQYIRAIKDDSGKSKTKYVKPIGRIYVEKDEEQSE